MEVEGGSSRQIAWHGFFVPALLFTPCVLVYGVFFIFLLAERYHLDAFQRGLVFIPAILTAILGNYIGGGLVDTFTRRNPGRALTMRGIRQNRAKVVVIDITGVPTIDSTVANHLVQTVEASRLMGASVIITGLSSEIAQTLVTIGVDLSKMNAVGDLQGGIEEAERLLGYKVIMAGELTPVQPPA